MALIELLVGLAVAAIVGMVATASLAAAGRVVQRHRLHVDRDDTAQMALAAMGADLAGSDAWQVCDFARHCRARRGQRSRYAVPVLLAGDVEWLADGRLRRCVATEDCHVFVEGVVHLDVFADMPLPDGKVRRVRWHESDGVAARSVEVVLTMRDGRRFSRVVTRRKGQADDAP